MTNIPVENSSVNPTAETNAQTRNVLFHFPDTTHDFQMLTSYLPTMRASLAKHNINFALHLSKSNPEYLLKIARDTNAVAVVTLKNFDEPTLAKLNENNIKAIPMLRPKGSQDWGFSEIAYKSGVAQAQMCFEAGYKHVSMVAFEGFAKLNALEARYQGICDEAAKHGQNHVELILLPGDDNGRMQVFLGQIRRNRKIDAICCLRNLGAASVMSMLREIGKNVPHDIGVVGYDDSPICEIMRPQLSLVSLQMDVVFETLAQSIVNLIDENGQEVHLPDTATQKVFRGTTR